MARGAIRVGTRRRIRRGGAKYDTRVSPHGEPRCADRCAIATIARHFRKRLAPRRRIGAPVPALPARMRRRARAGGCAGRRRVTVTIAPSLFPFSQSLERNRRPSGFHRSGARVLARSAGSHLCASLESADGTRAFRRRRVAARRRRRRTFARAEARRGVRAGRRRIFRGQRRGAAAVGERASAGDRRTRVDRARRFADRASAEPLRADDAHERALLRSARRERRIGLVVRRRLRSHAVLSVRRGCRALAHRRARSVRAVRRRRLSALQALVRRVFLSQASRRDARRRRAVLRRSRRRRVRALLRVDAARSATVSRRVPADRRAAQDDGFTASASASSSCIAAAVTSSSISSTTAARCSDCNPAGAPNRS